VASCTSSKYLWQDVLLCDKHCPIGYSKEGTKCVLTTSDALIVQFDKLTNSYLYEKTSLTVSMGSSQKYYTSYDDDDPLPAYLRGVFFDGKDDNASINPSSSSGVPLILSPTHQVSMWVKTVAESGIQTLLYKEESSKNQVTFSILSDGKLSISLRTQNSKNASSGISTLVGGSVKRNEWQFVTYSSAYKDSGSNVELYINSSKVSTLAVTNSFFKDATSAVDPVSMIGATKSNKKLTNLFNGFIASLSISAGSVSTPIVDANKCVSSTFCLSECKFTQFPSGTACGDCGTSCTLGCVRNTDCSLSLDTLCATAKDYKECLNCKALAVLSEGKCSCVENSAFSESARACQCSNNYKASSNNTCVLCKAYLYASEVKASWNFDYLSFSITFSKAVSTVTLTSCSSIFNAVTLGKLGTSPSCSWTSDKLLLVSLGSGASIGSETVILNEQNVLSSSGDCSYAAEALRPTLSMTESKPSPKASIKAPSKFSSSCSNSVTFSAINTSQGAGRPLTFKWAFSSVPANPSLTAYSSKDYSSTASQVEISVAALSTSVITATLEVKNWLNSTTTVTSTTSVESDKVLNLEVVGGSSQTTTKDKQVEVKAKTTGGCSSSTSSEQTTYVWSFVSTNSTTPYSYTPSADKPRILVISAGTLESGSLYTFKVQATQAGVSGSETLHLFIASQGIVVKLDKAGGSASSSKDLKVSAAGSYDPDNLPGVLTFAWICSQSGKLCESNSGSALSFEASSAELKVSKENLKQGASYSFTVTATKGTRSATKSVTFDISGPVDAEITISQPSQKANRDEQFKLEAGVSTTSSDVTIKWTQVAGTGVKPSTPDYYPYLQFDPNTLTDGQVFSYKLTITQGGTTINAAISFTVNRGPTSGSLSVSPTSGKAFSTTFTLAAVDWIDGDDTDYPLSYSFGHDSDQKERFMSLLSRSDTYSTISFAGNYNFLLKVCDALSTCTKAKSPVSVSKARLLQTSSVADKFTQAVDTMTDPDSVYSLISIYGKADLTLKDYDVLWAKFKEYCNREVLNSKTNPAVLTALESLTRHTELLVNETLSESVQYTLDRLNTVSETLRQEDFEQVLALYPNNEKVAVDFRLEMSRRQLEYSLPDSSEIASKTENSTLSAKRVTGTTFNATAISSGNTTVKFPPIEQTSISEEDVLDVVLNSVTRTASMLSDEVEVVVLKSGTYKNFIYTKKDTKVEDHFTGLENPINITLPINLLNQTLNYSCAYKAEDGAWVQDNTTVLTLVDNYTAVCSVYHLSSFSVQEVKPKRLEVPCEILGNCEDTEESSSACGANFAVVVIACLITVLLAVGIILVKTQSATDDIVVCEDDIKTAAHQHEIEVIIDETALKKGKTASYLMDFLASHLFISTYFAPTRVKRYAGLITTCVTVLAQIGFLGILYYFINDAGEEADDSYEGSEVFSHYTSADFGLCVAAIAICLPITAVLYVLLVSKQEMLRRVGFGLACLIGTVSVVCIGLLTNETCSEYSALWAVGLFFSTLIELVLMQSLFALGFVLHYYLKDRKEAKQAEE